MSKQLVSDEALAFYADMGRTLNRDLAAFAAAAQPAAAAAINELGKLFEIFAPDYVHPITEPSHRRPA